MGFKLFVKRIKTFKINKTGNIFTMGDQKTKRYYEFVTPEAYHRKPTNEITSKAVWEGFQEQTTAHGIPHVKNARGLSLHFVLGV